MTWWLKVLTLSCNTYWVIESKTGQELLINGIKWSVYIGAKDPWMEQRWSSGLLQYLVYDFE